MHYAYFSADAGAAKLTLEIPVCTFLFLFVPCKKTPSIYPQSFLSFLQALTFSLQFIFLMTLLFLTKDLNVFLQCGFPYPQIPYLQTRQHQLKKKFHKIKPQSAMPQALYQMQVIEMMCRQPLLQPPAISQIHNLPSALTETLSTLCLTCLPLFQ